MNLNKYQELAKGTALPGAWSLNYLVPGLAGETGELVDELTRSEADQSSVLSELADHFWFLALLCELMDWNIEAEFGNLEYNQRVSKALGADCNVKELVSDLIVYVGDMNSAWAKSVRDNGGNLNEKRVEQIHNGVANVLITIGAIAHRHGASIEELLQSNIDKLYDRKKRGVLGGVDGNNR